MLGNTELTATLGATPTPDADAKTWVNFARALASVGLPVLLVEPGTKRPLDMRTTTEYKTDTEANPGANTGGVHLATTDPAQLKKYVERALRDPAEKRPKTHPAPLGPGVRLNWAVRLGGSGYVVADADTPGEVAALRAFLAPAYGGEDKVPGPTVLTPGSADQSHHGGGHWWFKLPDGKELDPAVIPASMSVEVDGHAEGFSLLTGNAYALIPPSSRPEGEYHLVSPDNHVPLPIWAKLEHAQTEGKARAERRREYVQRAASGDLGSLEEQVAAWSATTPWEDLLEPHGWTPAGTVDSCGCDVWTAPGSHASPKSATAHGPACTQAHVDVLNPPLHIWTDNPGPGLEDYVAERGSKTVSRLTVSAYLDHGGNMGQAMAAAGITQDPTGLQFSPEGLSAAGTSKSAADSLAGVDREAAVASSGTESLGQRAVDVADYPAEDYADVDPEGRTWVPPRAPLDMSVNVTTPGGLDMWAAWSVPAPEDQADADRRRKLWPPLAPLGRYKDMPPTEYVVDGLLEHRALTSVIGDSGVGKSAVVLDMAAAIVAGQPWQGRATIQCPVLYVAGEGVAGAVDRLHAWERAHNCYAPEESLYLVEEAVLFGGRPDAWAFLAREVRRLGVGLVIFDTLARMSSGLDENSATDMGSAITVFDKLRRTTNAGVMYVHHTTRGTTHGRGTTALRGALDSEVLVTDTMQDGKPFAENERGQAVDADGNPLPGKPLTVMVTKQKNGPDDQYSQVCLTQRKDSMVVTGLDGEVTATPFLEGGGTVQLGTQRGESLLETAERVADYVARYTSGEQLPSMADIARGVAPDRLHRDKSRTEWRAVLDLAVDKALTNRLFYKVGSRYTSQPPLD